MTVGLLKKSLCFNAEKICELRTLHFQIPEENRNILLLMELWTAKKASLVHFWS